MAAFFEEAKEEGEEEELGLFGIGDGFQAVRDAFCVDASFEGRVGEAYGVFVFFGVLFGDAVFVVDFGVSDGVEHEVHGGDAEHGAVGIESGEGAAFEVVPVGIGHGVFVFSADIFGGAYQESGGAAGGVYSLPDFDTIQR